MLDMADLFEHAENECLYRLRRAFDRHDALHHVACRPEPHASVNCTRKSRVGGHVSGELIPQVQP